MFESSRSGDCGRRAFLGTLAGSSLVHAKPWTQFLDNGRGSLRHGQALPLEWSDDSNVAWRTPIPGYGQSSPVVSGDWAFATGVEGPNKETLLLTAFDLASGEPVWTCRRGSSQRIKDSNMVSKAAPTPAASEDAVFAFFETGNVLAVDRGGEVLWERKLTEQFGEFGGRHGIGSSLRLCGSGVLALVAHDRPSYLICLDPSTGRTVWNTPRPEGVSWSTPSVLTHMGREIALVSAGKSVEAYDTADGTLLWVIDGFEGAFIASPAPVAGGAVIGSSQKGRSAAIRFGTGVEEAPSVVWRADGASSYFSSPLVHRERVYMVSKAGVGFCLRADSGEQVWYSRLGGQCWASPIGLEDRIYFFGVDGITTVVGAGDEFVTLARNSLSVEGRLYGTAVIDDGILLRYGRELVRLIAS